MAMMPIRGASLFVEVVGQGPPLVLMHGGPGLDHVSLTPFRGLADLHTLVFYDHRCNGRSTDAPVTSMTLDNLTADADALREELGFAQWDVLGHSFGGHVALEYVLRYPQRVSSLILLDTAGDAWWSQERAAEVLAGRGSAGRRWPSLGGSTVGGSHGRTSSARRSGCCRRTTTGSASCGSPARCSRAGGG